jgi:hypothetical protein
VFSDLLIPACHAAQGLREPAVSAFIAFTEACEGEDFIFWRTPLISFMKKSAFITSFTIFLLFFSTTAFSQLSKDIYGKARLINEPGEGYPTGYLV